MPIIVITENTDIEALETATGMTFDDAFTGVEDVTLYATHGNEDAGLVLMLVSVATDNKSNFLTRFALPGVLSGATINSAKEGLFVTDRSSTNTMALHRCLRSWVETQATWAAYATGNNWAGDGVTGTGDMQATATATSSMSTATNFWHEITGLEADVQAWVGGATNNGWVNRFVSQDAHDSRYLFFQKSEGTDGNRPYLVIDYTAGAGDTTPPVLSSPTATVTGPTTATIGATTDEANGTQYLVVTTSNTQPSEAQIIAGQDHTGAAAVDADNISITTTGAHTHSATGLTAATAYYGHMLHRDTAGNNSNRVTTAQFTTDALAVLAFSTAGMEFGSRTGTAISTFALDASVNYRYEIFEQGMTLGTSIHLSAVVATDSNGRLPNYSSGLITTGEEYRVVAIRQTDGAAAIFTLEAT